MKIGNRYRVGSTGNVYEVARILTHESYPYVLHMMSMSEGFKASVYADAERSGIDALSAFNTWKQPIRVEDKWFDRKDVTEVT